MMSDQAAPAVEKLIALLDEVTKQTNKATHNILSKEEEIREHCVSLRNKVDVETENMIEEIRQWNEKTRNKINEYEKECLDKFNADEFEASASILKSLVGDITDHQKRIEQHIKDSLSDEDKISELIDETSTKLTRFKKQNMMTKKQKFSNRILQLTDNNFHPNCLATLKSFSLSGLVELQCMIPTPLRDMPDLKEADVFINPFGHPGELIAIVQDNSSKIRFVKMDPTGNILSVKNTDLSFRVMPGVQTLKDYFIIQNEDYNFLRFDYDFNEMEMNSEFNYDSISRGFAANQRSIFSIHLVEGKQLIRCSNHDLTHSEYLPSECEFNEVFDLLATDKYLHVWYGDRVRIIDIEYHEGHCRVRGVDEKPFEKPPSRFNVKMVLDEQIAVYHYEENIIRFYTADDKLELVKELKINIDDDTEQILISADSSGDFCFYNFETGDIYHSICTQEFI